MTERRRGLGRGLGALIPAGPMPGGDRPVDVFFPQPGRADAGAATVEAATPPVGTALLDRPGGPLAEGLDDVGLAGDQADAARAHAEAGPVGEDLTGEDEFGEEIGRGATDGMTHLLPTPGARFAEIPVSEIGPNERQPRRLFDPDDLAELVSSVREVGILQPVVVRPREESAGSGPAYELIMGERRWRAAQAAGMTAVPAIVRTAADADMLRDALLENLHRVQLNPLEEAAAYQQLLEDFGCTHEELAARVARSRPQISNTIRLLRLPASIQRRVAAGVLSAGHARAVLSLRDPDAMERLARRIVAEGLSVRAAEETANAWNDAERRVPRSRPVPAVPGHLEEIASRLSDRLSAPVRISVGQRKGRIAIEFATPEDLDRILQALAPGASADASADDLASDRGAGRRPGSDRD